MLKRCNIEIVIQILIRLLAARIPIRRDRLFSECNGINVLELAAFRLTGRPDDVFYEADAADGMCISSYHGSQRINRFQKMRFRVCAINVPHLLF